MCVRFLSFRKGVGYIQVKSQSDLYCRLINIPYTERRNGEVQVPPCPHSATEIRSCATYKTVQIKNYRIRSNKSKV